MSSKFSVCCAPCSAPAQLFLERWGRIGRRRPSAVIDALSGVFKRPKNPAAPYAPTRCR